MLPLTHTQTAAHAGDISNNNSVNKRNADQHFEILNPGLYSNTMFDKVSTFHYKDRVRLSFSVSEEWKTQYALMRGLLEFHRPKELTFTYDPKQKLVHTDTGIDQLGHLQSFLWMVYAMLKKERQFRIALKMAIEFERRYKLEQDSVYEVMGSASLKIKG